MPWDVRVLPRSASIAADDDADRMIFLYTSVAANCSHAKVAKLIWGNRKKERKKETT